MALPKINMAPKYSMTVPSTGEEVMFRPFLVKEEKVLMMAMETGDNKSSLTAIMDVIKSCVDADIDENDVTAFDVEYMFLQLRAKSIGETSKIGTACEQCNHEQMIVVPLNDIQVKQPSEPLPDVIELTKDISIKMKWPSYRNLIDAGVEPEKLNELDSVFKLIALCIDSVMTPEEQMKLSDESEEDQQEFLESLNSEQFTKIKEYVQNIPTVRYDVSVDCDGCGAKIEKPLTGIANFFS